MKKMFLFAIFFCFLFTSCADSDTIFNAIDTTSNAETVEKLEKANTDKITVIEKPEIPNDAMPAAGEELEATIEVDSYIDGDFFDLEAFVLACDMEIVDYSIVPVMPMYILSLHTKEGYGINIYRDVENMHGLKFDFFYDADDLSPQNIYMINLLPSVSDTLISTNYENLYMDPVSIKLLENLVNKLPNLNVGDCPYVDFPEPHSVLYDLKPTVFHVIGE